MEPLTAEMFKIASIDDGFFAIMARPSIDAEAPASIANIARLGIHQVVSLLEPTEASSLGLDPERTEVKAESMEFISFPIPDMGLPPSVDEFAQITVMLCKQISVGINTLIHCHAGIGRSGLVAAGILLHAGMKPEQAFAHVSKMRGIRVPETPEQQDWLLRNFSAIATIV